MLRVQTRHVRSRLSEHGRRIASTGIRRMFSDNNNMNNATDGVWIVPECLEERVLSTSLSGLERGSASARARMVKGNEAIFTVFYHEGYEELLLMLMRRRGVYSGSVVKGEEGGRFRCQQNPAL